MACGAFSSGHLRLVPGLRARVAFPGLVVGVPPHLGREVHGLGEAPLAHGAEPFLLSLSHAHFAAPLA